MKVIFNSLFILLFLINFNLAKAEEAKIKIAVFDLVPSGEIKTDLTALSEVIIAETDKFGKYDIIGKSEIKAMIGFEQEKQLLGCQDDTNCLAELGGALGVDRLVTGSVGKLGDTIIVSIKYIDTRQVKVLGRVYESFKGNESLLVDTIKRLIPRLFGVVVKDIELGTLIMNSTVKGATVYLDGNPVGKTPIEPMKLKPGKYNLQYTKPGYQTWTKQVEIKEKQASEITANLTKVSSDSISAGILNIPEQNNNKAGKVKPQKKKWYKEWWVWSVAAGVAVGSVAAFMALNGGSNQGQTLSERELVVNVPQPNE